MSELSELFERSPAKIAIGTMEGELVDVNPAYAEFFGFTREEMIGRSIAELGIIREEDLRRLLRLGEGLGPAMREVEVKMRHRDGRVFDVLMSADIIMVRGVQHRVATLMDLTVRKKLEADLAQAQKMDSVGRLAGGIAHDFNNILTAIRGYAKFIIDSLPAGDQSREDAQQILGLSDRAAELTSQLLAFSRRQMLLPRTVDLNDVVRETVKMLRRLIGAHIRVEAALAPEACFVEVDPGKIQQVLLNLALNARDAMPDGGVLSFETRVLGERVVCLVQDTGCGMTDDVKARAFEPFFTTKKGKGTGLGLSMAYGLIHQSGGAIAVESAPALGTTFRVLLPRAAASPAPEGRAVGEAEDRTGPGSATILLVEDEDGVRRVAQRMLVQSGYTVMCAADGDQALALLAERGGPVDLLITDVVMPGLGGRELARRVAERRLARRTVLMSGYTDQSFEAGSDVLLKPFTEESLLRKVREALGGA